MKPTLHTHAVRWLACWLLAAVPVAHTAADTAQPSAQNLGAGVGVVAATCFTCHGPGGRAPAGEAIPSLQGRDADLLLQRLRAFKAAGPGADAGATIMPLLLQAYDDAQLQALASWFAKETP